MSRLEHETTTIFPSGLSTFIYYSLLKQSQTSAFSPTVADLEKLTMLKNKTIKINKKKQPKNSKNIRGIFGEKRIT